LTTRSALRCGHCLDPLDEANATEVAGALVCPTCARLARRVPTPGDSAIEGEPAAADPAPTGAAAEDDAGLVVHGSVAFLTALRRDIDEWCVGRWWIARLPLLLLFAWTWLGHATRPEYRSLFGGLNLGIHELGHYVFAPFGDLPGVFGGSLLQCLAPLLAGAMFVRQRDWFAVAVAIAWFGTSCFEVALYAGDAVRMELPLVTPGGGHPIHDWNYLLGAKGWLRHTELVSGIYRTTGQIALAASTAAMAWLLLKMIRSPRPERPAGGPSGRPFGGSPGSPSGG